MDDETPEHTRTINPDSGEAKSLATPAIEAKEHAAESSRSGEEHAAHAQEAANRSTTPKETAHNPAKHGMWHHPILAGIIGAVLAAFITAAIQYSATRQQINAEDRRVADADDRRRLAVVILLVSDLSDIRSEARTWHSLLSKQTYAMVAANWRFDSTPLRRWDSVDLALFNKDFLNNFGTLLNHIESHNAKAETIRLVHQKEPSSVLSDDELNQLESILVAINVDVEDLAAKGIAIYDHARSQEMPRP